MSNSQMLTPSVAPVDYVAQYSYPATVKVLELIGTGGNLHFIISSAAITPSSTVLAKAPNGSICIDAHAASGAMIWVKTQTTGFGGIDGTWYHLTIG